MDWNSSDLSVALYHLQQLVRIRYRIPPSFEERLTLLIDRMLVRVETLMGVKHEPR